MASIIFTDILGNCREVKFEECISLELKLNLTRYGQKYRELGDILYKYKTNYGYSSQLSFKQTIGTEALLYIDDIYFLKYL
jgi:hypothetical protein